MVGMKRVLIACECSGEVRRAFNRHEGILAWSCDLKPADDGDQRHLQMDALEAISRTFSRWDLIIAHPECRYVCASGMHWTTRGLRDPKLTERAIEFAEALWAAPCSRVVVENPRGCLSTRSKLGKPTQSIQPYQFGDDASKETFLWIRGDLPKLTPTIYIPPRIVNGKPRWSNQTDSGQNKLGPSPERSALRAKTYPGIAAAMADQWAPVLLREVA